MACDFFELLKSHSERCDTSLNKLSVACGHSRYYLSRVISRGGSITEKDIYRLGDILELNEDEREEFVMAGLLAITPKLVREKFEKLLARGN